MKKLSTCMKVIIIFTTLFAASLMAKPVPEDQRVPVDVRRTTFVVKDADASLALYRDALGMKVIYDQVLEGGDFRQPESYKKRRLVLLRANDDFIGVLGLLQYMAPLKPEHQDRFDVPVPGDPIVVINAENLEQVWAKVITVPGLEVLDAPEKETARIEFPRQPNGENVKSLDMSRVPSGRYLLVIKGNGKLARRFQVIIR